MRQDLIEKLRRGEIGIINDGQVRLINMILNEAFPKGVTSVKGFCRQFGFCKSPVNSSSWVYLHDRNDEDFKGQTFVRPEEFLEPNKAKYKPIFDEELKTTEKLNKELRETLRLKKEITELGKLQDIKSYHFPLRITSTPTRNGSDWLEDMFDENVGDKEKLRKMYEGHWDEVVNATEKLQTNNWYKCRAGLPKALVCLTDNSTKSGRLTHNCGYGFNDKGLWEDNYNLCATRPEELIPATKEEVQTALSREAIKQGFVEGVEIHSVSCTGKSLYEDEPKRITNTDFEYDEKDNSLDFDSRKGSKYRLFKDGKWAEIIKDAKPKPQLPKIGCSKGVEYPNAIRYGSKLIPKSTIRDLEDAGVTSLTIDNKHLVYNHELRQIYKVAKQ